MARTMVLTGMNWSEYVGGWELGDDSVTIGGTKTKERKRVIPRIINNLVKPTRSNIAFRRAIRKVNPTISPYSFRRTFALWMVEAGIPEWRRNKYMGHKPRTITEGYEEGPVERHFKDDIDTMLAYLIRPYKKEVEKGKPGDFIPFHALHTSYKL
jgi:integrase